VQPTPGQLGGSDARDAEAEFTIPPELLVHNNNLTIEFIGPLHNGLRRPGQHDDALGARASQHVSRHSGRLVALADDLKQLPMPFLDPAVIQR